MSRKSSFWKALGGKSRKSRRGWQKRSYARPVMSVEQLEDRYMLSANPVLSLMQNQFFGQDTQAGVNIERGLPFHATFTDVVDQVDIDNESVQTWVATIDWGDGSPIDRSDVPALNGTHPDKSLVAISPTIHTPFLANRAAGDLITGQVEGFHNYATVGDFTVTVTLTDSNGGVADTQSTPVKVYAYDRDDHGNGGAQIGFDDIFEQTPYSLTLDGSASRNHNITSWTISWGDSVETFNGNPSSVTHTYNDDDDFRDPYFGDSPYVPIIAAVTGENGTFVVSRTITIHDVEPVVTAHAGSNDLITNESAIVDINEGETFSITNMSYSGDAAEPIQAWLIVWGDETPDVTPQDLVHPGDITSALHDYAPNGNATYFVFFAPVDSDGSSPGTFVVEVHVHNLPPIADAGGPYTVDEGGSITLNGLGSSDAPGTRPLASYDWDLDGDGEFDDATGPTPVFDAAGIDGTANYTIYLQVTDQDGATAVSSTTLTVANAAPIADFAGTSVEEAASSATVAFSNPLDPSVDDTAAGFHYAYDFDSDGIFEIGDGSYGGSVSSDSAVVPASYLADGGATQNITGRIIDKDGGYTDYIVNVANVAPTLTISGAASVSEGSSYTLNLSSFDPGADTITSWTINWGDATPAQIVSGNPSSVSHTYADGDNNYTISATATDEDGTYDAAGTVAVAVSNVAPALSLSGAAAVAEGSLYTLGLSSFDPGADTIISWTINWGDATPAQTVSGNPASISHSYADGNNNYTISATATDEDGEFAAGNTVSVAVSNVKPTASFSGGGTVNEGSAAGTVAFSSQLDPSAADTSAGFHYAYDFNNDGTFDVGDGSYGGSVTAASQPVPASFLVDGDATYNIKGRIIDKDGGFTDYTAAIIVLNVAPTLTISGGASVNEGSSYTLNLSSFDPGADTINHWTINWGDSSQTVSGNPSSVSHIYADGIASYTISATATDEDGTYNAGNTVGVTVNNVAPTLAISGAASVNEGSSYTLNLSKSDPGTDTISQWTINWGDGTQTVGGSPANVTHVYSDGTINYTISATATDEDGTYAASNTVAVTVNNVAPTLAISGAAGVNEGSSYTLNLASTDPGADTISQWTINWGDSAQVISGNPTSVSHTYADGTTSYTISATATDEDGTYAAGNTVGVTVNNVAPTLTLSGAASVNEGSGYTLNLSKSDPGADTISQWTINWGDSVQVVAGSPSSVSHTYADGTVAYTISATATDEDGTYAAGNTVAVTVNNVAPTLTLSGAATVNEGSTYTLNLSKSDPGVDTINHWTINWGDGIQTVSGSPASVTHVYADGTISYTISATATDEDGTFAAGNTVGVTVNNVAPTLAISGAASVNEGSSYTLNLSKSDPGADTINHWTINWGDGTQAVSGSPASVTHVYADGTISYTISATATDEDGTFVAGNMVGVTVNNVAPALAINGAASVNEGSTYTLNLSKSDPGADTINHWTINWGDGTQAVSGSPTSVTHVYADGTVNYTISATATDEDGTFAAGNTVAVTVQNVAPTANAGGPYATFDDAPITLTGSGTDPAGTLDPLTFKWDLDGDGIFGETGAAATRGNEDVANATYNPTGLPTSTQTIKLQVSDGDGGVTVATTTVQILGQGTIAIGGVLYIVGSNTANDIVSITQSGNTITVLATFNSNNPVTFNASTITDIQVRMRGGNDIVVTTPDIMETMTIDGGAGNDLLTGGGARSVIIGGTGNDILYGAAGNDVLLGGDGNDDIFGGDGNDILVGGNGNDILDGGNGRDVLIGSQDEDSLSGGNDEDILIGGYTVHDNNVAALDSIMAIWGSSASFSSRVATLSGSGGLLQAGTKVFDDDDHDQLVGDAGRDLYFGDNNPADHVTDSISLQALQDQLIAVT